jgi:RimJ/RimL family protein N-acetyltransferase
MNLYFKWFNDATVRKYSRNALPITLEQLKKDFDQPRSFSPENTFFEIIYKPENKVVGDVGLHHIRWISRIASLGLGIGEIEYWSKGIATEAAQLILNYGFTELNLHKISAHIFSPNIASQKCAQKIGMKLEATLTETEFIDGQYCGESIYSAFQSDWLAKQKL